MKDRFVGEILGVGTAEGTRIVVGCWATSPYGRFADVMVERSDRNRLLFAPTQEICEYVASTYVFDALRVLPVHVDRTERSLGVVAGPLRMTATLGTRTPVGWVLRLLPSAVARSVWFSRVTDPIARIALPGVRTRGTAGGGRLEVYGAHDVRAVTSLTASWEGRSLGNLAPVEPPPHFGFGSTPRRPAVTTLTTTVLRSR